MLSIFRPRLIADISYLLARFFSEQLNGATVPVLQVDNSGAYGHGTNQEATVGSCEVATECRQEDTKNLRTHVSATQSPVDRANTYASPLRLGSPWRWVFLE